MRHLFTFLTAVLLTANVFLPQQASAQSPEKMSYQAVIRNSSDQLVTKHAVGMQISILQGAADGTAVYTETQTPTTNANGLVSIEIGAGTIVSGDFATIDWAAATYFIKTETDPEGGTDYTITGVSQLLSVPYALHAKTAETFTGTLDETDPTYTSSQAANITTTDITNLGNLSGTNTGDQDLSTLATSTALGDSTAQVRSEIPDVNGFLSSETDPVFTKSEAFNIKSKDITNLFNLSGTNRGDQDISGIAVNMQAIKDTAAQIRADFPDVSGFLSSETDPLFTGWDKDYADLINTPTTITTAQADAIVANTAKNSYPAADATKLAGIEDGAQVNVQADWDATAGDALILNKPDIPEAADGSETKVTAGANVSVTGAGTTASPYVVNATGGPGGTALAIGDSYQGGIIFWLDATGQHGLIAATEDQSTDKWVNLTYRFTGSTGDGLYAGAMNTAIIIATQMAEDNDNTGYFAAKICADYSVTVGGVTYGDWYLPSKYELNLLYKQKTVVGGFGSNDYWSSNEKSASEAWVVFFGLGNDYTNTKVTMNNVRAVRAF